MGKHTVKRETETFLRGCDECRFWSDQQARIERRGAISAICLNPASSYSGQWRTEAKTCKAFERGEPIDLPDVERRGAA